MPQDDIARLEKDVKAVLQLVQDSREAQAGVTVSLNNITDEQRKMSQSMVEIQRALGDSAIKTALLESDLRAVQQGYEGLSAKIDAEAEKAETKITTESQKVESKLAEVEGELQGLLIRAGWAAGALAVLGVLLRFGPVIFSALA